jgi:hypothetical protein
MDPSPAVPALPSSAPPRRLVRLGGLLLLLLALALPSGGLLADENGGGDKPGAPAKPEGEPGAADPEGGSTADDDLFDAPTTFTAEQVDSTIRRGVQWLKNKQNKDGGWGDLRSGPGAQNYQGQRVSASGLHAPGLTALALYTLLKCKVSLKDPAIKRGFAYVKTAKQDVPDASYPCSMLLLAVCATADTSKSTKASQKVKPKLTGEYFGWAKKLADELLAKKKAGKVLGWRYNHKGQGEPPGGPQDLSSTQLATLALFAAHRVGVKVPDKVWEDILEFSLAQQDDDGPPVEVKDPLTGKSTTHKARGFSYVKGYASAGEGTPTGGMTACGLANVMMARFVLNDAGRKQEAWDKRPDAKKVQDGVYDGLAWLQANWSAYGNPKGRQGGEYHHYWHYALERAMDLIGNQKIGDHFWYSEIGQELINRQDPKGFWKSGTTPYDPNDALDTCFSLLFLRRATKGNIPFPSVTGGTDEGPVDNR